MRVIPCVYSATVINAPLRMYILTCVPSLV
ncbi:hypothetical protein QGX15_gp002 [Pseudomonas phage psageK4e]|uniref:Uncharacterized protein n=1 Tax=Pseudomonas phage psageK4e TaxID=2875723 RepID=A0AAE8XQ77_9CAUD|nr:hypothetical protein QGX15_gp002 [Pseudomonas phage psageK4e]UAW53450.1 hypothetical protein psageK4e_002 [Pseudomonas phage psageK4e]